METLIRPEMPQDVKAVFASYPVAAQAKFNALLLRATGHSLCSLSGGFRLLL